MRALKRYCFLALMFFVGGTLRLLDFSMRKYFFPSSNVVRHFEKTDKIEPKILSYMSLEDLRDSTERFELMVDQKISKNFDPRRCTMNECFNFTRCRNSFKIHIYPIEINRDPPTESDKVSEGYGKILAALKNGNYFTSDPEEACLFVLSFDTLDRDVLSGDYVKNLNRKIAGLPENLWNGGLNHLIFNLYPGTWPNYEPTDLGFDAGKSIIAKASFSVGDFRPLFDVSLPLFHKTLPLSGGGVSSETIFDVGAPLRRSYLLVFKGKRYVHGIGSETRNSLYHLHNGRDVIMLTTCKHGKNWKQVKDERCDADNEIYDKWNYEELIHNSSFCLIPRGRRLGSFRFLEAMEAGCIPVILSNEWELPFSETIDWKSAVIWADERLLFQLPSVLRSVPLEKIMQMRQDAKYLSRLYFSTVEQIVFTTLEIIRHRLNPSISPDGWVWNRATGGLYSYLPRRYSDVVVDDYPRPFYQNFVGNQRISVVVSVAKVVSADVVSLWKFVNRILKSKYIDTIYVLFPSDQVLPSSLRGFSDPKRIKLLSSNNPNGFFSGLDSLNVRIETEVVFIMDSRANLNAEEIDFAFEVWRWFPHRLVGYYVYNHYWNSDAKQWKLASALSNCYSLLSDFALVVHRYYLQLYDARAKDMRIESRPDDGCFDVKLNLLSFQLTGEPPIKLTSKQLTQTTNTNFADRTYFTAKEKCFNDAASPMSIDMSLGKSCVRFDPVLYLDPVSNLRKKYRQMELTR